MVYAKYRLSDGRFICGWPNPPEFDPATEAVQEYPEHVRPDLRLHRFDGSSPDKKRLATPAELATYDTERQDNAALARLDGSEFKMIKALAIWTAGKLSIPLAQARQEILALYKSL